MVDSKSLSINLPETINKNEPTSSGGGLNSLKHREVNIEWG